MILPPYIKTLSAPNTLLPTAPKMQQMKEVIVPRNFPNVQNIHKAIIISGYIICILGILP